MNTSTNTASTINTNNTNTTDGVVLCCAGDLCPQLNGPTIIGNGHPCIVCQGIMHGGPCSDGMVEDPNGMNCKKCAAAKEKSTGGEGGGEEEDGSTTTKEGSKDDEVLVVGKPESFLDDATLMDFVTSQSEVNCVFKTKNKLLIRTKLVSIKGKAIAC